MTVGYLKTALRVGSAHIVEVGAHDSSDQRLAAVRSVHFVTCIDGSLQAPVTTETETERAHADYQCW